MWYSALEHYSDRIVADFLAFGWPINYRSAAFPEPSSSNHPSAVRFPDTIDAFLSTEIEYAATAGPFLHNPFPTPLQTSPLQTVPKDGSKRRVVLDLSFPQGTSVNDGIPTDSFLDEPFHLTLPRSADFVNLIVAKGPGCYLFKKDLKRAYRQIPVDPKDYILLGYRWQDLFYFDLVLPFGLRSATLACQRTTSAIAHIFGTAYHHDCVNYIDDFGGVEASYDDALLAFSHLEEIITSLGLESSPTKDCPPTTRMVFLGLTYDTVAMTLEVPPDKLHHISQLLSHWLSSPRVSRSELQSLIGKLSYLCACISPGRIFMQRILRELRRLPHKFTRLTPSPELLADLRWWDKFLSVYNGVSLLRSSPWIDNESRFSTDACLSGIGGFFDGRFFHSAYPPFIDPVSLTIASLEMLAVTISVKLWSEDLRGQRVLVRTDNQNTELALNTGRSRVPFVQSCLRELWFYASLFDFELRALYIPGHENTIADSLSRWDTDPHFRVTFRDAVSPYYDHLSEYVCSFDLFRFECQW